MNKRRQVSSSGWGLVWRSESTYRLSRFGVWVLACGLLLALSGLYALGVQVGRSEQQWIVDCADGEFVAWDERCE